MDDLLLVDVVESFADLPDDWAGIGVLHPVRLPEQLQQLSASAVLNEQVYVLLVLEVAVERSHVSMVEEELNAQLSCDLIHVLLLPDLLLGHHLHAA
jgi:hypothetical protein